MCELGSGRRTHTLVPACQPGRASLRQVECGAEVIVTQPPLVWPLFETWLDALNRCGLAHRVAQGAPPLLCLRIFAHQALCQV